LSTLATDLEAVAAALERAQSVLWDTQRADGSWESPGDMGSMPTAQVLVALHHAGRLDPRDAADGARWLRGRQGADGSYVAYPTAPHGDLGATACAWAALHVTAPAESAEAIARARSFVDSRGGTAAVVEALERGDLAAVYLALAGLADPRELPCPPMLPALIDPAVRFMERRFHSGILMVSMQLGVLARRLRGDWAADGPPAGALARRYCARTVRLLRTFQNRSGSFNANTVQTALALPALRAAGLADGHPMVASTAAWLEQQRVRDEEGLHFDVFGSPVWCTAANLRALFTAGARPDDPRAIRALDWLVDAQSDIPQPEVDNRNPGAPRTGGWAFQPGNETMVDNDDTGAVLSAFGAALAYGGEDAVDARVSGSLARGRDWLLGMQNPDGGWSAFVHGLPGKRRGPMFTSTIAVSLDDPVAAFRTLLRPPPELGDPSTEDLTGRALDGLGRIGFTVEAPEVRRAIEFLRAQQCGNGGFWGRWTVNYLAATACVLMGLARVGADMSEDWVRHAVRFVLDRQNDDGGWGELPDSYADPALAGIGPSMPPVTGLVLTALIDAREQGSDAVARGVDYLLAEQRSDGTWPHADWLQANVPPDTFYILAEAARHYPAEALGRFLEARG
jgi:squalene-hopene/tetraprenyl-beta-curcumene cyclase